MKSRMLKKVTAMLIVGAFALGTIGTAATAEEVAAPETEAVEMLETETAEELLELNEGAGETECHVTYCYNGEGGFVSETITVPAGAAVLDYFPTPAVTGKVFRGWRTEAGVMVDASTAAYDGMTVAAVFHTHKPSVVPGKEATCTEPGLTEGSVCETCGEILTAQGGIPAKGHDEEILPRVEPTETETGLTEGKKCKVCGIVTVEQQVIPATGGEETETYTVTYAYLDAEQNLVTGTVPVRKGQLVLEVLPTVSVEGKEFQHWVIVDDEGNKEIVTDSMTANGNLYVSAVMKRPSVHTHTPVEVDGVAATCTQDGRNPGTICGECGDILQGMEVIPAKGHTEEVIPEVPATEKETGLTEGKKCSVCGEILKVQAVIPALGHTHNLTFVDAVPATEEQDGTAAHYACSGCGKLFADSGATQELSAEDIVIQAAGKTEEPETEEPETEEPETEKPETEEPETEETEPETKDSETEKSGTTGSGKNSDSASSSDQGASPNTGDNTKVFGWLFALLASGVAVVYLSRRRLPLQ